LDSLTFQCSRRRIVQPPEDKDLKIAIEAVASRYGEKIRLPKFLREMNVYSSDFDIGVAGMLTHIQPDGSPGVPLKNMGSFNKNVLDSHLKFFKSVLKDRLYLLKTTTNDQIKKYSAKELVQLGFVDPVRLFVKNEPHPARKAIAKRWRLIHSVSLIDQAVERILNQHVNSKEISRWDRIPSKPGMGFSQGDICKIVENFEAMRAIGDVAASDVEGFDFSVQSWMFEAEAKIRLLLHDEDLTGTYYERMLLNRAYCVSTKVFQTSNGILYSQDEGGIQPSGSYCTSSANSRIRVLMAQLVGSNAANAAGDDCNELWVEDAKEKYDKLGVRLKFYEKIIGNNFEFCSHIYDIPSKTAYAVGLIKETMTFINKKRTKEFLLNQDTYKLQYSDDLVGNPLLDEVVDVMRELGCW